MATVEFDTHTPPEAARTLGHMVTGALIQAASDLNALRDIKTAFDVGDTEKARLIVNNQLASGSYRDLDSLQRSLYESLPRTGEPTSGF